MNISEILIGDWCVVIGSDGRSRLEIRADGTFVDTVASGNLRMWGRWTVSLVSMESVLQLELDGGSPMFADGANGARVRVNFPPVIAWPLHDVTNNKIVFAKGVMNRATTTVETLNRTPSAAPAAETAADIYAKIRADDAKGTADRLKADADQTASEVAANLTNTANWSGAVHEGSAKFTKLINN